MSATDGNPIGTGEGRYYTSGTGIHDDDHVVVPDRETAREFDLPKGRNIPVPREEELSDPPRDAEGSVYDRDVPGASVKFTLVETGRDDRLLATRIAVTDRDDGDDGRGREGRVRELERQLRDLQARVRRLERRVGEGDREGVRRRVADLERVTSRLIDALVSADERRQSDLKDLRDDL